MNEIIYYLSGCVLIMIGLPALVYLCTKMATLGYLRAREHFNKSQSQEREREET